MVSSEEKKQLFFYRTKQDSYPIHKSYIATLQSYPPCIDK